MYPSGWTGDSKPASAADKSSTFSIPGQPDQQLSAPLLNITTNNLANSDSNIYYQGRTFDVAQLQDMGTCVPEQRNQWDFSLILLFMWLSVTRLLSIFMYLVWQFTTGNLTNYPRKPIKCSEVFAQQWR
jgi:hypothetical protein